MNSKLRFILELLGAATLRSVINGEFYTLGVYKMRQYILEQPLSNWRDT